MTQGEKRGRGAMGVECTLAFSIGTGGPLRGCGICASPCFLPAVGGVHSCSAFATPTHNTFVFWALTFLSRAPACAEASLACSTSSALALAAALAASISLLDSSACLARSPPCDRGLKAALAMALSAGVIGRSSNVRMSSSVMAPMSSSSCTRAASASRPSSAAFAVASLRSA
eukprot:1187720-Prorocentrum_minimum.AAC.2